MLARLTCYRGGIFSLLIGLFFILILHFKLSYSLIPILLAVSGIVLLIPHIKNRNFSWSAEDKLLCITFFFYFFLFFISMLVFKGKGRELDLPSRALLALPILVVCYKNKLKQHWIIYALLIASIGAGISALIQIFLLQPKPFLFTAHMYIQAGGIVMTLAVFSFVILFYFHRQKNKLMVYISLAAGLLAVTASFLIKARGAWLALPVGIITILWLYRKHLSKWLVLGITLSIVAGGIVAGEQLQKRYKDAERDLIAYSKGRSSTSLGARFDMWKSAVIGIKEKPVFGWGLEGVKEMRHQHAKDKLISKMASNFDHAHNQFLHDTSARGILGLIALLAIFLVPLRLFWLNLNHNINTHLWGSLGITHIIMMMVYCLSQGFLSHNSGVIFYFVTLIILYGLQKSSQKQPLARPVCNQEEQ